jgi:hypothetical protein
MKTAKRPAAKPRPIAVGCLAAQVLGRSRTTNPAFTAHDMALAFPGFQPMEIDNALSELVDKDLVKQRGREEHATYQLTDRGRDSRVVVD